MKEVGSVVTNGSREIGRPLTIIKGTNEQATISVIAMEVSK